MVAHELADEDPWFYLRAYTAGLQEYVEALSFFHHLKNGGLISLKEVQDRLTTKASSYGATEPPSMDNLSIKDGENNGSGQKNELGAEEKSGKNDTNASNATTTEAVMINEATGTRTMYRYTEPKIRIQFRL